jgi:hypothetical protein
MSRLGSFVFLFLGAGALIAPQANLGLPELRWLSRYSFAGEAFIGVVLLGVGYYLLGSSRRDDTQTRPPAE